MFATIIQYVVTLLYRRLAEYGWKPHRAFLDPKKLIMGLNLLGYA